MKDWKLWILYRIIWLDGKNVCKHTWIALSQLIINFFRISSNFFSFFFQHIFIQRAQINQQLLCEKRQINKKKNLRNKKTWNKIANKIVQQLITSQWEQNKVDLTKPWSLTTIEQRSKSWMVSWLIIMATFFFFYKLKERKFYWIALRWLISQKKSFHWSVYLLVYIET